MTLEAVLDDPHQTSVYIPYQGPDTDKSYTLFPDRDLPNGYERRLAAYKTAWSKCLRRVQELIHALHAPIVDRVAELVNKAYTDTLPGLPYTELPVIPVTVFGTSSSIFDDISARLEAEGQDGLFDDAVGTHIVNHLFPQDCPTLASALKALITGFIRKTEEELGSAKRKPAASLSTVDINLLQVWFDALCLTRGSDNHATRLVVVLHDFEQFDTLVIQDLFEISSLAVPRLPLVYVLSMTSPPTPSYIHATYSRSTLSLLQVRSCSFSTSQDVLHDILLKTFFDVEFDPDLVLGPTAIEFLSDFFGRHSPSLDGLVSILQLAHMKHFEEPCTIFLSEEGLTFKDLAHANSGPFLGCLLARVQSSSLPAHNAGSMAEDVDELLVLVRTARKTFYEKSKLLRVSFQLFLVLQRFVASLGHKSEKSLPELMCAAIRGRLGTSYRYLCMVIKTLPTNQLDKLLLDIDNFFDDAPAQVQGTETEIISRITAARSVTCAHSPQEEHDVAEAVGDWLLDYFRHRLVSLEELPLWDIWYSGSTPFTSELFNPNLRASIFSGLLHPRNYDLVPVAYDNGDDDDEILLDMPDTSILFNRYLESGKMINVFDWFESFTVVLEAQKRRARQDAEQARMALTRTPSRRKGKQRQSEEDKDKDCCEETEEELEKWRLEVQARFIRSLHELDYVGLIKHTGRKADHVMRTVFDVPG